MFPTSVSDVRTQTDGDTHSFSHYANTSSHILLCSQTITSIIREGALQLLALLFDFHLWGLLHAGATALPAPLSQGNTINWLTNI